MSRSTEQLFDDIARFVDESRTLLSQGAYIELAGLDEQVRSLCEEVLHLTQDDRLRYAERLQGLLGALKDLGETMVEQRDRLAEELRGIPKLKNASTAYRIADSRDDFGKRDEEDD